MAVACVAVVATPLLCCGRGCCSAWHLHKRGTKSVWKPCHLCSQGRFSHRHQTRKSLPFSFIPGKELWQAFAVCAAGVQETVLGYQAVLLVHLNPDPAAVPPLAALERQVPLPRECQSSCSAPLYSRWVFSVAESKAVLHSPVHLNRALVANIFC